VTTCRKTHLEKAPGHCHGNQTPTFSPIAPTGPFGIWRRRHVHLVGTDVEIAASIVGDVCLLGLLLGHHIKRARRADRVKAEPPRELSVVISAPSIVFVWWTRPMALSVGALPRHAARQAVPLRCYRFRGSDVRASWSITNKSILHASISILRS